MTPSNRLLSDLVASRTYAKYLPHLQRREILEETINRTMEMYLSRFPKLSREITKAFSKVHAREVLPSMRAVQFAGPPVDANNARAYNCSYTTMTHPRKFSEGLFLLLSGTGFGFSVQKHHINQLPKVQKPRDESRYLIPDSIEGWALALQALLDGYFYRSVRPLFDYSLIRAKGTRLVTSGSKAPGPGPLKVMLEAVEKKMQAAVGRRLASLEVHDIMCIISDCVLAGGIRRSAMISLFDRDDAAMLKCKSGKWYETAPYRARANNSAVLPRWEVTEEEFRHIMKQCEDSKAGEPGVFWTSDPDKNMGTNPCQPADATLLTPQGIRTLGELNVGDVVWSGQRWTKITKKWSTGIKDVFKYTTSFGYFLGTKEHRVVENGIKVQVQEAETIDWNVGPSPEARPWNPSDVMAGLLIGDGTVHKASNNLVLLCIGDQDRETYLNSEITQLLGRERTGIQKYAWEVESDITAEELPKTYERTIPERYFKGSPNTRMGFLRGLFSANGSIVGGRVTLKAASGVLIRQVQEMLSSLGIPSYITTNRPNKVQFSNGSYTCRQSYDLNITTGRTKFKELVGFLHAYKNEKLTPGGSPKHTSTPVQSVSLVKTCEVFDLTVEAEEHTYWTGGLLVSNCCEISLNPNQFCNLTTINLTSVKNEKDFLSRVHSATLIGTLQAGLTDFPYLGSEWRATTEREALLGVSMTGIADVPGLMTAEMLETGAKYAVELNQKYAKRVGINPAARITAVKPEGTASCVLGSSSGVHSRKSAHYIRRFQISKDDALYHYLVGKIPSLVEDYRMGVNTACVAIPQESPEGSVLEPTETALALLSRVMLYNKHWVKQGHVSGANRHNVSTTLSIGDDEWAGVVKAMWKERNDYTGISCLPRDLGSYEQAPFEPITKEQFDSMNKCIPELNLADVLEIEDETALAETAACAGGACEVTYLK